MQSYFHSFELNELPPSILNQRVHWTKRNEIAHKFKLLVWKHVAGYRPLRPLTKYKIILTRHTIRPLDPFDNLPASFKAIVDALTELKIIQDDKWGMGDMISARQVKVSTKKEQKVTIHIEELCNVQS